MIWNQDTLKKELRDAGFSLENLDALDVLFAQLDLYERNSGADGFSNDIGETVALVGLNRYIDDAIKASPDLASSPLSTLKSQVNSRVTELITTIPKNLHFVWIGRIGGVQRDFIEVWLRANPDYAGTLWYDGEALLSYELKKRILDFTAAVSQDPNATADQILSSTKLENVLKLQDAAYQFIREQQAAGLTFDQAAARFMQERLGASPQEIERTRLSNQKVFTDFQAELRDSYGQDFQIRDVQDQPEAFWRGTQEIYARELGLRNNLAAASDIVRLLALAEGENPGGVYVDPDLLPLIKEDEIFNDPDLNSVAKDAAQELEEQRSFELFLSESVLNTLQDSGRDLLLNRNRDSYGHDPRQELIDAGYADVVDYVESSLSGLSSQGVGDVFQGLGDMNSAKGSLKFFAAFSSDEGEEPEPDIGNGNIASNGSEYLIDAQLESIKEKYTALSKSGALDSASDKGDVSDKLVQDFKYDEEKAAELANYRFDGLVENSRATVSITLDYAGTVEAQIDRNITGGSAELEDGALFNSLLADFILVDSVVSVFTAEELDHSWIGDYAAVETPLYRNNTQYETQWVIRLDNSPQTERAASYLNRKHSNRSQQTRLDEATGRFVRESNSGEFALHQNSRIILVGRSDGSGADATISGLTAQQLSEKLADIIPQEGVGRISIVGSSEHPGAGGAEFLSSAFPDSLASQLSSRGTRVESISTRSSLIQVDVLGRKWYGRLEQGTDGVLWSRSSVSSKIITTLDSSGSPISRVADVAEGPVLELASVPGGGAVLDGSPIQTREVFYDRLHVTPSIKESPIATTTTQAEQSSSGSIVSVADSRSLALLFNAGENARASIFGSASEVAGIQEAILSASSAGNYQEWITDMRKQFSASTVDHVEAVIRASGVDTSDFASLQSLVNEGRIDFHVTDLVQVGTGDSVVSSVLFEPGLDGSPLNAEGVSVVNFGGLVQENVQSTNGANIAENLKTILQSPTGNFVSVVEQEGGTIVTEQTSAEGSLSILDRLSSGTGSNASDANNTSGGDRDAGAGTGIDGIPQPDALTDDIVDRGGGGGGSVTDSDDNSGGVDVDDGNTDDDRKDEEDRTTENDAV